MAELQTNNKPLEADSQGDAPKTADIEVDAVKLLAEDTGRADTSNLESEPSIPKLDISGEGGEKLAQTAGEAAKDSGSEGPALIPELDIDKFEDGVHVDDELAISDTDSEKSIAGRVENIRELFGDMAKDLPEAYLENIVNVADRLKEASPEDMQKIFENGANQAQSDYPDIPGPMYARMMNAAVQGNDSGLRVNTIQSVYSIGLLSMDGAEGEPRKIVGRAFLEGSEQDKLAYDTAEEIGDFAESAEKNVPEGKVERFHGVLSAMNSEMENAKLWEPLPDVGPRAKPESQPSETQVMGNLFKDFGGVLKTSENPVQATQDLIAIADTIAFSEPSQIQDRFSEGFAAFSKRNPDISPSMYGRMLANVLNSTTGTDDYSVGTQSSSLDTMVLRDKRMATESNPNGNIAMELTGGFDFDPSVDREAFRAATQVKKMMRNANESKASVEGNYDSQQFADTVFNMVPMLRD